ncbi:MAG TPA: FkbM family methyltransferase [Polyangiaceae bacterium]|nr:FkbM family methyltransferase [Polyangiaceae bacterium]
MKVMLEPFEGTRSMSVRERVLYKLKHSLWHAKRRVPPAARLKAEDLLLNWHIRPGAPSMFRALSVLKRGGFEPTQIIDVGAHHGDWAVDALELWPNSRVLMLEAREAERPVLERRRRESGGRAEFEICLLGPEERENAHFFELELGGTGSSVLEELSPVPRQKKVLPMRRLDNVARQRDFQAAQLLKLDVQGFELQVLEGAKEVLSRAEVVVSEVALLPYNQGAPLMAEVIDYFDKRDFQLFDLGSIMRDRAQRAVQVDALFVRRDSPLRNRTS